MQPDGFPVSGQPVRFFCEDTASSTVYIGSNIANNPHLDFEETRRQIEIAAGGVQSCLGHGWRGALKVMSPVLTLAIRFRGVGIYWS